MKLRILIADDQELNRMLLSRLVTQLGHTAILAANGREALQLYETAHPDLVLMDIMMPEMNGLDAIMAIRALPHTLWVPIVVLSALSEQEDIIRGLKAGADDYITKPLQIDVLHAKLRNFERSIAAQCQLEAQNTELRRYHFASEDEKRIASHLMQSLIDADRLNIPGLQWWLRPADAFSGDVMAAATTPAGIHHLMLADGTGHGLPAALAAQPLPEIFYAMTAHGHTIGNIAQEMNRRISRLLPIDRFFAATLVAIDQREQSIEVWNGGSPGVLLLDPDGKPAHVFTSHHLPLGIIRDRDCSAETERLPYQPQQQLMLMSDGFLDTCVEQAHIDGMQRLLALAAQHAPSERLAAIQAYVGTRLDVQPAQDDLSLMIVDLGQLMAPRTLPTHIADTYADEAWRLGLSLQGNQLRLMNQEVVPFLMGALERLSQLSDHRGTVFVVLSELFNNALDHGLLELDSALKESVDGFDRYLALRQQRLAALDNTARIDLEIEMQPGARLCIMVRDSGQGFDHRNVLRQLQNIRNHHGRGLALVMGLGAQLEYLGKGNEARATLVCRTGHTP